jgi:hypothetical protein
LLGQKNSEPGKTGSAARKERFEPLLAGDRQTGARVAKARIPSQNGCVESVCRELPRMALAA